MPSLRQSPGMDTSPPRPSRTVRRLFSGILLAGCSADVSHETQDGVSGGLDFCLMLHSSGGHDEPEILRSSSR